jgi:hypothetical protein
MLRTSSASIKRAVLIKHAVQKTVKNEGVDDGRYAVPDSNICATIRC